MKRTDNVKSCTMSHGGPALATEARELAAPRVDHEHEVARAFRDLGLA